MNEQVSEYLRSIAREEAAGMWSSASPYLSNLRLGLNDLLRQAASSTGAQAPAASSSSSNMPSGAGIGGGLPPPQPRHHQQHQPSQFQAADHSAAMAYRQGLIDAVTATSTAGGPPGGSSIHHSLLQAAGSVGGGRPTVAPNAPHGTPSSSVSATAELLLAAENNRRMMRADRVLSDYQLRAAFSNAGGGQRAPAGLGHFQRSATVTMSSGDFSRSLLGPAAVASGNTLGTTGTHDNSSLQTQNEAGGGKETSSEEPGTNDRFVNSTPKAHQDSSGNEVLSPALSSAGCVTASSAVDLLRQQHRASASPEARCLSVLSRATSLPSNPGVVALGNESQSYSSAAHAASSIATKPHPDGVQKAAPKKRGRKPGSGKKKRTRPKKPKDMPRRPLSAYNIFFRDSRARILNSIPSPTNANDIDDQSGTKERPYGKKPHGKIGFENLAKVIGRQWNESSEIVRERYRAMAEEEMKRYKVEMAAYKERVRVEQEEARKRQQEEEARKRQHEEKARKVSQEEAEDHPEDEDRDKDVPVEESGNNHHHDPAPIEASPPMSPVLLAQSKEEPPLKKLSKATTHESSPASRSCHMQSLPQDVDELLSQSRLKSPSSSKKNSLLSRASNLSSIKAKIKALPMVPRKPQKQKPTEPVEKNPKHQQKCQETPTTENKKNPSLFNSSPGGADKGAKPSSSTVEKTRSYLKGFRTSGGR